MTRTDDELEPTRSAYVPSDSAYPRESDQRVSNEAESAAPSAEPDLPRTPAQNEVVTDGVPGVQAKPGAAAGRRDVGGEAMKYEG